MNPQQEQSQEITDTLDEIVDELIPVDTSELMEIQPPPDELNPVRLSRPPIRPIGPLPKEFTHPTDDATMILIPAGEFIYGIDKEVRDSIILSLGSPLLEVFEGEFPRTVLHLGSFYIDKYEVTNRQYARFMKETGHRPPKYWGNRLYNDPEQPVVGVGWHDAMAYAKWADKRLPSEEEWEKAARGTDGRIWPWGNEPAGDRYIGKARGHFAPTKVGIEPSGASPYGVMDMAGNVYEMTTGNWKRGQKAMRGGSYLNSGAYTRTTFRWATEDENNGSEYLGFRCVADTTFVIEYFKTRK